MCPVPPTTTVTSNTSSTNEPNDDEDDVTMSSSETSLNIERSKKQRIYDYDSDAETEVWQLSAIATDWTLMINRLAANCRNISDEVFPGIHVGDRGAAKNKFYLKKIGVTHVLNTAEGSRIGSVDTNQSFYKPFGIKYKGLQLLDVAQCNIAMYFPECAEFIDEALKSGGKVLVNCLMGMSRSSTCVLAYLMMRQNMTAVEALTEVRRHREVRPNDGFLRQLADLDNKLRRERGQLS